LLAESIIRRFLPQIDLGSLESHASPSTALEASHSQDSPATVANDASESNREPSGEAADGEDYIPLVDGEDPLRFTDSGELDFHGISSGAAFLSRITRDCPQLLQFDARIPFLPETPRSGLPLRAGRPGSPAGHGAARYNYSKLPPRELARMLCEYSFNHASCLLRILHVPSFYKSFDALYDGKEATEKRENASFVGLLYAILALGSMYDVDENDPSNPDHYNEATSRG
jgi:hypothetical protein